VEPSTDPEKLLALVRKPLEIEAAFGQIRVHVACRIPPARRLHRKRTGHSRGIPWRKGINAVHVLDAPPTHCGGPRAMGLTQKLGKFRRLRAESRYVIVPRLRFRPRRHRDMGYKHRALATGGVTTPPCTQLLLKIIATSTAAPDCELVESNTRKESRGKGARLGPASRLLCRTSCRMPGPWSRNGRSLEVVARTVQYRWRI